MIIPRTIYSPMFNQVSISIFLFRLWRYSCGTIYGYLRASAQCINHGPPAASGVTMLHTERTIHSRIALSSMYHALYVGYSDCFLWPVQRGNRGPEVGWW
jgi:hypothetical protein